MAIRSYQENGKTLFKVYVNYRSQNNPQHRIQKRKNGIINISKARLVEKDLLESCIIEMEKKEGKGISWRELVDKWAAYKALDKFEPISDFVLSDYHKGLKKWTAKILKLPVKEVSRSDVKEILSNMEQMGCSKGFQAKMKYLINKIFLWGMEERVLKDVLQSPTTGIKINQKSERVPTILNRQEIVKLLETAKFYQHEWYPIWAMAVYTGCRNGELFALTWDDIDFATSSIRLSKSYNKRTRATKCTKAGYWRNIPINPVLKEIILELKQKSTGPFVLPRPGEWHRGCQAQVLREFCKHIGITSIRFHDLRACFATQLLQNNVSPATVMKICGWRDLETMGRYIRVAGIDEAGATDKLRFLSSKEACDNIIDFIHRPKPNDG